MSEQHSIAEASSHLDELVRKAEKGEAVELTREGEAVAVLIGRREYERRNGGAQTSPWEAYQEWRRSVDWSEMGDPAEIWANVRYRGPGRDPKL